MINSHERDVNPLPLGSALETLNALSFDASRALAFAVTAFFVLAVPVWAQDSEARQFSVGAAAGIATPFHSDFEFTATSWQADVRFDTLRHFGFGAFLEEWRHTDEEVHTDRTIVGPTGPLGRVDRVTTRTEHRTRAVGVNWLARGTIARVTLSGGGGVSYLQYSRNFNQTLTGCDPAALCDNFSNEFDNSSFAAQVQAGVDVAIAPHVAVMGQFRLLVPTRDPGGGHNTFMGGVRAVF